MLPELVIFDCDGVLVDSEPVANSILAGAITRLGFPMSVADTRAAFVGLSMGQILVNIPELTGRPVPEDWRENVQAETYAAFRQSLRAVPGAGEVVARIQAAKIPLCVASSGSLDKMQLTLGLTGLRRYFGDRLFSSTMVARGKPHPDLFLHAAAQMGVAPNRAVVIEDSVPGVAGARAAGMRVFAYAGDPESDAARLRAEGGQVFTAMADLPQLLGID
ncbi:MAG: HAD family hydrolase [Alphaproteobacteria bacterium]|nr:HAD family hydrolase [Alphaproteobacteria bacterium]